jgi:hypothetical protein
MIDAHEHFLENFLDGRNVFEGDIAIDELLLFNLSVDDGIDELVDGFGIGFAEASR